MYSSTKNTVFNIISLIVLTVLMSCTANPHPAVEDKTAAKSVSETVPDSIVQFLLVSAALDFRTHQPPAPVDFRNIRIGYLASPDSERTYLLCGDFLSAENKEWISFTTIKTSGYEQYLGKTQYCEEATMVLTDADLSVKLKKAFTEN